MSHVPGYTGDVFISYAHLDDYDGWVTEVKSKISARLTNDLAGEPEVWFDADRLRTGDIFKQDIHDKLSNTLIFLAVISPSYLKSEFCMERELDRFLDEFGRDIFQLQKVRLSEGTTLPLPGVIYEALFDEAVDAPLRGERLDAKLNGIISTIRRKMEKARQDCRKVYLAQPGNPALRSACKDLGRALHRNGIAVLPDEVVIARTLESKIQTWIEKADASIHILTNPPDPLSTIQLRLAERAATPTILLEGAPTASQIQGIVDQTIELLKQTRRTGELYFIYDCHSDGECANQLTAEIGRCSARRVVIPQPGETYHKSKLEESDGIVLFRGTAPQAWFEAHREKVRQAAALRRGRIVPEVYYLARSGAPENVVCNQDGPYRWAIDRVGAPAAADLRPFFDALEHSAAAGSPV